MLYIYVEQFRLMLSTFSFFVSSAALIAAARNDRALRALRQGGLKISRLAFGASREYVDNVRRFFGEGRKGFGIEVLRYTFFPDRDKIIISACIAVQF